MSRIMKHIFALCIVAVVVISTGCAVFNDRAARAVADVPVYMEVGELNKIRLTELERFVLAEYHAARTIDEALENIPRIVQVQLPYKHSLWGLHIAYGYVLDYLVKHRPNHPALAESTRFYSSLLEKHGNNDIVLYWAARAYDRRGVAVNGLAARYYERAIERNNNNRWYLRDYIRGPTPAPVTTMQPFFRAEPGRYRHLYPMYVRLVFLEPTNAAAARWKKEFRLLKECEGKTCDFKTLTDESSGTPAREEGLK